jgi:hypothetical protein
MAIQRDPSKEGQPVDGTLRVDPRSRALGRQWREPVTLSVFFHFLVATREMVEWLPTVLAGIVALPADEILQGGGSPFPCDKLVHASYSRVTNMRWIM